MAVGDVQVLRGPAAGREGDRRRRAVSCTPGERCGSRKARSRRLFAALEIATGKVTGVCKQRHRHQEFLAFLKHVARAYPDRELHLVMDNYAAHVCPESEVREM